jgi:hypothetical protein
MSHKWIITLFVFIGVSYSLSAQNNTAYPDKSYRSHISLNGEKADITIESDSYPWYPFDRRIGYSLYGSQYRKARCSRDWGIILSAVIAPASTLLIIKGINEDTFGNVIVGALGVAGGLGAGIPLWVKGRKELDWMMDDYNRRYGPQSLESNLSLGATTNGIGLAFNF